MKDKYIKKTKVIKIALSLNWGKICSTGRQIK